MEPVVMQPVAVVRRDRRDLESGDWGSGIAEIVLTDPRLSADSLLGLEGFSHVEVITVLHRIDPSEVEWGTRRPRGDARWPEVGVFARRSPRHPNRLALSRCEVAHVREEILTVRGLDVVDGTPVLDIKPWMAAFGPRGPQREPAWTAELLSGYY